MAPRRDFGKTGGVVNLHYALPFPRYIIWQALKGLGLWIFGWFRGPGEDETSALEGTFMIGNWRRCKVSLGNSQSISPNLNDRIWWKEAKMVASL